MAVYNGEKHLPEQLDSILGMLGPDDELVVSYDQSTDRTLDIIQEYCRKDPRIRCVHNARKAGVCGNFTNAVQHCKGDYIFLSDQDDVWLSEKIEVMITAMAQQQADMAVHDGVFTDETLHPAPGTMFGATKATTNPVANFVHGRFYGCCMAFRKETMRYLLPFPDVTRHIPHDIFSTIMVGLKGKICLVDQVLIYHRLHANNVTPTKRNKLLAVVKNRIVLLACVLHRLVTCAVTARRVGSKPC